MKLDLHELVLQKLDWDDKIPDNLQPIWESHFQMMNEIKTLKYQRAVIPEDTIDTQIDTLDFGDASREIACIAIYARFKRKDGSYSCQLVFARSQLIPTKMTQPLAELYAALIKTHTGEIVRRDFKQHHTNAFKFTDNQRVLLWISNENRLLKQWVCSRIVQIKRFADPDQWRYMHISNMIADLGTRRGTTLEDINSSSQWINGLSWMTKEVEDLPMKPVRELFLSSDEVNQMKEEIPSNKEFNDVSTNQQVHSASIHHKSNIPEEVTSRYLLSNYILDPNKLHFSKVIRIVALVKNYKN